MSGAGSSRLAWTLALVGALALTGCGSLAPTYEQPPLPVAERYPETGAPASSGANAPSDLAWQQYFSDPRLKELIELSLRFNRDLRVAVTNIEVARAQWQIGRSAQVPSLNATAIGNRETNPNGGSTSSYLAGLNVPQFELDFFGRVKNLSDAALGQYLATEEARKTVQIVLVATVANAYLELLGAVEQLALTGQTLATREESLQLTRMKFDNGVASTLDVAQQQSLVEGARVALQILKRQRMQTENTLVLLIGRPVTLDLPSGPTMVGMSIGPELPVGLPSELLASRPDIRQSEQQLRAANANFGAARAACFPRITLTGSGGVASGTLTDLFKSGGLAWSFTPQLVLPIFNGGLNQANLDVATAQREISLAQYDKTVQTAFREVADALAGRATLTQQLQAQKAQAAAEQTRFDLSDLRYRNGVASYLEVLDAQRALFVAQLATVQVKVTQLQNQVTLYQVLGGGWTEPAPN